MCKILLTIAALAAAGLFLASSVYAQDQPLSCANATGLDFNNSLLFGTWFEVARNPANNASACIQISVNRSISDNNTLSVNVTHSSSNSSLYQNIDETAQIVLVANQTDGYNVTFASAGVNQTPIFTKLLQQIDANGVNWLVGCGYTNISDPSTSFGYLLANTIVNQTAILSVNNQAAQNFTNFNNETIDLIGQQGCYRSSAAQIFPVLSTFMALVYMLLKAF